MKRKTIVYQNVSILKTCVIPVSSFPSDVLKWMKKNANCKQSWKLTKICKYFKDKFHVRKMIVKQNGTFKLFSLWGNFKNLSFDKVPNNLWISEYLEIRGNFETRPNIISSFVTKLGATVTIFID